MVSHSSIPSLISDELNLSYSGCGFLGMYHVGVASCFHQYAPQLSMHKMTGTSVGCVVACAHICGNPQLALTSQEILRIAIKARSTMLGPFHPSFDINKVLWEVLDRGMPQDCHQRASGRLHISLTRVRDGKNIIINEFDSREDLMQLIICSCFIPFWSGLVPPTYRGEAYIDGGFSDNLPRIDKHTVTVSPFSGESDICPLDRSHTLVQVTMANMSFLLSADNIYKVKCALLPPSPKILSQLCQMGFEDGIRFLQRTNRINTNLSGTTNTNHNTNTNRIILDRRIFNNVQKNWLHWENFCVEKTKWRVYLNNLEQFLLFFNQKLYIGYPNQATKFLQFMLRYVPQCILYK